MPPVGQLKRSATRAGAGEGHGIRMTSLYSHPPLLDHSRAFPLPVDRQSLLRNSIHQGRKTVTDGPASYRTASTLYSYPGLQAKKPMPSRLRRLTRQRKVKSSCVPTQISHTSPATCFSFAISHLWHS